MQAVGDFRPGTISVNFRKCGKERCACAQPGHPGHGPQYLWNTTSGGQSRAQNLRLGPELEKAHRELENHQMFLRSGIGRDQRKDLSAAPGGRDQGGEGTGGSEKKIAEAVFGEAAQEIDRLVQRIFQDVAQRGHVDLEASEMAIRAASHRIGGRLLEKLLNADEGGYQGSGLDCGQGHSARFVEYRRKRLVTVLAPVDVRRAYYHCDRCGEGIIPKDRELDMVDTGFSPGVRRMMGQVGRKEAFDDGRKDLELLAGLAFTTKAVERVAEAIGEQIEQQNQREQKQILLGKVVPFVGQATIPNLYVAIDGSGVPVVARETEGRQGKDETGQAKTREAKLGCVFTQTMVDHEGYAVRDEESTT